MTSGRTYQLTITSNSRKGYKITATLSGVSLATCRGMIGPKAQSISILESVDMEEEKLQRHKKV